MEICTQEVNRGVLLIVTTVGRSGKQDWAEKQVEPWRVPTESWANLTGNAEVGIVFNRGPKLRQWKSHWSNCWMWAALGRGSLNFNSPPQQRAKLRELLSCETLAITPRSFILIRRTPVVYTSIYYSICLILAFFFFFCKDIMSDLSHWSSPVKRTGRRQFREKHWKNSPGLLSNSSKRHMKKVRDVSENKIKKSYLGRMLILALLGELMVTRGMMGWFYR